MTKSDFKNARILIVDDEKNVRRSLSIVLEDSGYAVSQAEDAMRAMDRMRSEAFDLLILDIRMGEISGLQLFQRIRSEGHLTPVLLNNGNASLSEAVETMRLGGADFLEKPFAPERLMVAVTRALRMGSLERELSELRDSAAAVKARHEMIGQGSAIRSLWAAIEKVAPTRSKVLIQGESGSGKELIARAIHKSSLVAKGPFIKVNCAAIPSELIESELFGHERGAFTGATQLKRGLFELANGGTIFLDEIAEMSPAAQAKALRVLQSQELSRVGGAHVIKVDVRVIAATHRDLAKEVKEGRFREDLFFRLNVVPLRSLPLRERKEDIPILVTSFIGECCEENGFGPKAVSSEALSALIGYSWPGNIRELRNLVERLVIFSGDRIELDDLPDDLRAKEKVSSSELIIATSRSEATLGVAPGSLPLDQFKKKAERDYIVATLRLTHGNVSRAANLLNLERTYLHRKIQEHAIQKKEYF